MLHRCIDALSRACAVVFASVLVGMALNGYSEHHGIYRCVSYTGVFDISADICEHTRCRVSHALVYAQFVH